MKETIFCFCAAMMVCPGCITDKRKTELLISSEAIQIPDKEVSSPENQNDPITTRTDSEQEDQRLDASRSVISESKEMTVERKYSSGVLQDGDFMNRSKVSVISDWDIVSSARYAVTQYLHSPQSVHFPVWPDESYKIRQIDQAVYLVSGRVRAKNAFGVELQEPWDTKIEFSGPNFDNVRATYIRIGNQILLNVQ